MRVLYVSRACTPHDRRFLAALTAAGHAVGFLPAGEALSDPAGLPKGVSLRSGSIAEAVSFFQPDVTQAGPVPTSAYLAAKAEIHPLVAVSWGSDILAAGEKDRSKARFVLDRCDLFLCDSLEVAGAARRISGISADRVVRFPWGVELSRFVPAPVRSTVMNVVSTRSWEPGYGIETVLTAFAAARLLEPQLSLTLFGGGSLESRIRRFIAKNNLEHAVLLRGGVPEAELPLYLAAADLYLSAAPVDGSSISLLEALATGLPAIVTDRPSNREWVTPHVNGWVAPPGDARAFSDAIVQAVRTPFVEREKMRTANIALVRARADWTKHAATYLRALDSVAGAVPA